MNSHLLHVKELQTQFITDEGTVPAVDDVSFYVNPGEVLGIVGESGCGKSVTSLSVMGLVPSPPGKITGGEILFDGKDLTEASEKQMQKIRGNEIAMIFQEPMTSLNPVIKIGDQLIEGVRIHTDKSRKQAKEQAMDMLQKVGLSRVDELMSQYPHQLSGGMRQRVMIAMAFICEPKVLIADEPTTALDVTIQKQILNLMKQLNSEMHTAIILITHDLGVVAEMCDRVVVMYAGKIVEEATVKEIFNDPKHPYTKGLIQSVPDLRQRKDKLYSIPGNVPKPGQIKSGCVFAPRCAYAFETCGQEMPKLCSTEGSQQVRCWLYHEK
ncbi:oligopeptide transport ATP-binding protein OppD [Paraliobacillus ryukyuensis]|uniref:Peptide/nickel transport system ATP-binding protein n=1 Tax=Paraliobacillus ryukyuensis TaxID=200904 RepID=A0A366EF39_9BACI|nr:peptide/nickel transport system ATP-binding protein [Paraliobacillus ryukyuensis]